MVGMATVAVLGGMVMASLGARHTVGLREGLVRFVAAQARERAAGDAVRAGSVRTALYGAANEPNPELAYAMAAAMLGRRDWRPAMWQVAQSASGREAAWPAAQPIVALLQRAVHATTAPQHAIGFFEQHKFHHLLGLARERAVDRGEWQASVEAWLDQVAVRIDARMHGSGLQLDQAWSEARLGQLDVAAMRVLGEGLARLDERWPRREDAVGFLANRADTILRTGRVPRWFPPGVGDHLRAWQHGFDPVRMELESIAAFVQGLPAMREEGTSWAARAEGWAALLGCSSAVTATASYLRDLLESERSLHGELARIRLLRLAIAFRLGEPLPELADPFADRPLQSEVHADRAHFRSAATHVVLQRVAYRR